jgi:periplasmic divalent cation tolerance protein
MDIILIYITNPTKEEAVKISSHLLMKKLIACANIFPVDSLYWWKGKIANEKEFVIIAKTSENNFGKVKDEVERIHSYTIPCIIKIKAGANDKYCKCLKGEIEE